MEIISRVARIPYDTGIFMGMKETCRDIYRGYKATFYEQPGDSYYYEVTDRIGAIIHTEQRKENLDSLILRFHEIADKDIKEMGLEP